MAYTTILIMLALAQYMYFIGRTGAARGKYDIQAPACTGNEDFERRFRVQQNTMEQLIIFIPAQISFAWYVSPAWGAAIGIVFLAGRFLYSNAYITAPEKRAPGMLMTLIANAVLVIGAITGAALSVAGMS
ncbi:MAG: MAPEG family protein [Thiotrichales bacterium]|nr:MAPEG family protein [Thiotrichales bacterium]